MPSTVEPYEEALTGEGGQVLSLRYPWLQQEARQFNLLVSDIVDIAIWVWDLSGTSFWQVDCKASQELNSLGWLGDMDLIEVASQHIKHFANPSTCFRLVYVKFSF